MKSLEFLDRIYVEREVGIYFLSNRELSPMGRLFVEFCDAYF